MKQVVLVFICLLFNHSLLAQEVNFQTVDKAIIHANFNIRGAHAVLLAHGAIFNKESWGTFETRLLDEGYTVLAIDFRGYGQSTQGTETGALYRDILAGVQFLQSQKAIDKVTVLGASMGGGAAAQANIYAQGQGMDQLILLSPVRVAQAKKLKGSLLFISSEHEGMVKSIKQSYQQAHQPKKLALIKGAAHAQHIFKTDQAESLQQIILDFLR